MRCRRGAPRVGLHRVSKEQAGWRVFAGLPGWRGDVGLRLGLSCRKEIPVLARLFIVIAIGAVLAVGGSMLTAIYLSGMTSGTPANAPLYNYGTG